MTPEQRRQVMGWLNECSGRAYRARQNFDHAEARRWEGYRDYWRNILKYDTAPPGTFPEESG